MKTKIDLVSSNLGTIITIAPASTRGWTWLRAYVQGATATLLGPDSYLSCDHRCGVDILQGAHRAGLRLQDAATGRISRRYA